MEKKPYSITQPSIDSTCEATPEGDSTNDSFKELLAAFDATEDVRAADRFDALDTWLKRHGDVNADVILPALAKDALPDNRGSPALIACELDYAQALANLVARGADVNYRHPASHGGMPFLRCAEMGYNECLEVLLSVPDLDVEVVTNEYKLVLGQKVPQYEAGGRNALLLAVESCRIDSVKLLLAHAKCRSRLLEAEDSFGRTPLKAAFQKAALKRTQDGMVVEEENPILVIAQLLCNALGQDFSEARAALAPVNAEDALAQWRERNVELRQRFLKKSHAEREENATRGREAVAVHYEKAGLRKHPEVYASSFPQAAVLQPRLVGDTQEVTSPDSTATMDGSRGQSGECGSLVVDGLKEPMPGVLHFPLLTEAHCAKLYDELQHYEATARAEPDLGLPLYVRHDGNFGALQDCGFAPLLQSVEEVLRKVVRQCLPSKGDCEVYHAFLTRNWVGREENATFKIHCDKSDLTFNLCLHASSDFEGSTVGFYEAPMRDGETPTEELRRHTLVHRVGHAAVHDGSAWHKTDPIIKGTRSSLIVWARLTGQPCPACGASMGATWLFCKSCGAEVAGR